MMAVTAETTAGVGAAAGATTTAALKAGMIAADAEDGAETIADAAPATMMAVTAAAMPGVDAAVARMTARPGAAMTTRAITAGPTTDPGQKPRIRPGLARTVRTISPKCGGCGDAARMTPSFWTITEGVWIATGASSPEMIAGSMVDKRAYPSTAVGCSCSHGPNGQANGERMLIPRDASFERTA
jgi:hypothetical protein